MPELCTLPKWRNVYTYRHVYIYLHLRRWLYRNRLWTRLDNQSYHWKFISSRLISCAITKNIARIFFILYAKSFLVLPIYGFKNLFHLLSITQTDINECSSNPCLNGGTCNNLVNSYSCSCPSGYTGTNCEAGKRWNNWN